MKNRNIILLTLFIWLTNALLFALPYVVYQEEKDKTPSVKEFQERIDNKYHKL